MLRLSLIFLGLLLLAVPAEAAPDALSIDLANPAAIATRRAALINLGWGVSNGVIPVNLPSVVTGITNPWPALTGVSRVDQYTWTPATHATVDTINISNLYWPITPNGRMVMINMGHQGYCDWSRFHTAYNTQSVVQTLLNAGFAVYTMNMPACTASGDVNYQLNTHYTMWSSWGDTAMQYFLDPMIQATNYWQRHGTFKEFNCIGLSGGGFTCLYVATYDPRITLSVHTAGSFAGIPLLGCNDNNTGDPDGRNADVMNLVTTLDQYVMSSYEANMTRRQIQVLNVGDDCCYGPTQWTSCESNSYGGMNWYQYTAYYLSITQAAKPGFPGMNYMLVPDYTSTSHQISAWNLANVIMPALNREVSGARRRF
jgi:hypothetical protein